MLKENNIYMKLGLRAIKRQMKMEEARRNKKGFYNEDGEYVPAPKYKKYSKKTKR